MFKKITFFILIFTALLTVGNTIYAQDDLDIDLNLENATINPRTFALGITTLKEHGFGAKTRFRSGHFAVDASIGSMPWLIMYETSDGQTTNTDFDMSLHADLGLVLFINNDQSRFQNGIRLGGAYDSIGGNAAMLGWTGELTFKSFAVCFGLGFQYYPDIIENLNDHFPDTRYAELDSSQKIQYYLGVNCIWYLF